MGARNIANVTFTVDRRNDDLYISTVPDTNFETAFQTFKLNQNTHAAVVTKSCNLDVFQSLMKLHDEVQYNDLSQFHNSVLTHYRIQKKYEI